MKHHSLASLARLSGIDIRCLRRWRNEGLLMPVARTAGSRLLFTEESLDLAKRKSLGLSGPAPAAPLINHTLIRSQFSARRRTTANPPQRNNRNHDS